MSMQIALIGLVVFILVIIFERRRLGILADYERQRTDAVKRFWEANERRLKSDRELSQKVQQALDGVATLMQAERQRATAAAQQAAGPMTGTGANLAKSRAPVGGFTQDGVYHENGNPVAWFDVQRNEWRNRDGQVVPDPTLNQRMQLRASGLMGMHVLRPQSLASISTLGRSDDDEQAARRRRANEAAWNDAQVNGLGVLYTGQGGTTHVPSHEFRGSGGTFDGGGSSGNYDSGSSSASASDSCSSSSASSSSSDSSSSCSSSDSGGGSSGSD